MNTDHVQEANDRAARLEVLKRVRRSLEAAGSHLATAELDAREYNLGLGSIIAAREALTTAFNVIRLHLGEVTE